MDIASITFLIFLSISLLIYWKLSRNGQWILLLLCSIVFFLLNTKIFTLIYIAATIISVYFSTRYFEADKPEKQKKCVLILTLILNIGILAVLKYTNLGIHTINIIFNFMGGSGELMSDVHWVSPIAISFYTLQIISYLLDCYWGIAKPYRNIAKLALYTMYFPQMISGPISRFSDIGEQLFEKHEFDYDRVTTGMRRIAWGLLKKIAISNRLAVIVNIMYGDTTIFTGGWIWVSTIIWTVQLFTDFSGCMDIVLGASQCFGIQLPENFNAPFFSINIQEFWRRWHITLGTWLRDYIMNPILRTKMCTKMGKWGQKKFGKKMGRKVPVFFAMLVLWLCMGLWHGNSWKYIIGEGFWFWFVIVAGQILEKPFKNIKTIFHIKDGNVMWKSFQRIRTILIFVVGQIFFRADSFMIAIYMIRNSFKNFISSFTPQSIKNVIKTILDMGAINEMGGKMGFGILCILMMVLIAIEYLRYCNFNVQKILTDRSIIIRWAVYFIVIFFLLLSLNTAAVDFTYAQF